jgi:hypothetical protein
LTTGRLLRIVTSHWLRFVLDGRPLVKKVRHHICSAPEIQMGIRGKQTMLNEFTASLILWLSQAALRRFQTASDSTKPGELIAIVSASPGHVHTHEQRRRGNSVHEIVGQPVLGGVILAEIMTQIKA